MTLPYDTIRTIAQELIKQVKPVTPDVIHAKAREAMALGAASGVDYEHLVRDLESRFSAWIGKGAILDDHSPDHLAWLPARRGELPWDFWSRYRDYLETVKAFEPVVVRRLDELTDEILERCENPRRPGTWDRRGMVVGQVQSGKTANYTGLICKALDAGYKLIVILTGMHNSLRSQTQLRLDEGVIGIDTRRTLSFDPDNPNLIGVGLQPYPKRLLVHTLTASTEQGDFKRAIADSATFVLGGDPVVLAVKKNSSVLRNLTTWASAVAARRDETSGRMLIRDTPLLLIDDEADVASVNTKIVPLNDDGTTPDDYEVSKINGAIRSFLHLFDQKAYVAYTATPFANIFIHPDHETEQLGEDLFPRSFIISLPVPSRYVGPIQVFGLRGDPDAGIEEQSGLDIIRHVDDQALWMPDKHRKDHVPAALPASVIEAMHCFLLGCATRAARGQAREHKSMLIHVTRFTAVQQIVAELVREALVGMRNRLEFGDGNSPEQFIDILRELWENEFVPTSESMGDLAGERVTWDEVRTHLLRETKKIEVKTINGSANDVLEYVENSRDGLSVIAIGGDKLSRGLTLEGLMISYYLRASKMYDTLMQMGRWFGYRPGYVDLCRLYTTDELEDWYRHITLASEELRQEFEMMAAAGQTPQEFGLRVRTHPDGLLITAANKLRDGTKVQLSFDADLSETIVFDKDTTTLEGNRRAVELLIEDLGGAAAAKPLDGERIPYGWTGVDGQRIVEFLAAFRTHDKSRKARSPLLQAYISQQIDEDELVDWTVALISKEAADRHCDLAGIRVGLTRRAPYPVDTPPADRFAIRQLHSPRDELIDLSEQERDKALRLTLEARQDVNTKPPEDPSGTAARHARDKRRGLLMIYPLDYRVEGKPELSASAELPPMGLVFSFPASDTARSIEYTVNNVYWEQEFGS